MQPTYFLRAIALLGVGVGACASPRAAATSTTGGDLSSPSGVSAKEATPADASWGQLTCRTTSVTEGTSELYLDWSGPTAKGFVRTVAPSGMVYVQRVRAERYKDAIIVDEPSSVDLVSHAAVVGRQDGKQHMRVGDRKRPWLVCQ